jgi:hypothetical protein
MLRWCENGLGWVSLSQHYICGVFHIEFLLNIGCILYPHFFGNGRKLSVPLLVFEKIRIEILFRMLIWPWSTGPKRQLQTRPTMTVNPSPGLSFFLLELAFLCLFLLPFTFCLFFYLWTPHRRPPPTTSPPSHKTNKENDQDKCKQQHGFPIDKGVFLYLYKMLILCFTGSQLMDATATFTTLKASEHSDQLQWPMTPQYLAMSNTYMICFDIFDNTSAVTSRWQGSQPQYTSPHFKEFFSFIFFQFYMLLSRYRL